MPQVGIPIGMVLGTLVLSLMTLLPDEKFIAWGWRIPFILSALLVVLGLWIRHGIDETPAFKEVQKAGKVPKLPVMDTLRFHWKEVLIAVGAKFVETAPFYIFSTFIVSYATINLGFSRTTTLTAVMIASVITSLLIPVMGALSDKVGRKKLYVIGTIVMIVYMFPYFWMVNQKSVPLLVIATILGLGIIWAPITAVLGTFFSEIFAPEIRYTGVTLGYQIGAALAGGTAPLIAVAFLSYYESYVPIAIYIMFTGVISLVAISFAKNKKSSFKD